MNQENKYESERQESLLHKAEIVASMTQEVKLKIVSEGYTPTEVATAYILRKFQISENDYRLIDTNSLNIKLQPSLPNYKSIVFNDSGTQIINIIF